MNQVKVIKNKDGVVLVQNTKKPDYHYFLVEEISKLSITGDGFLSKIRKMALPVGPNELEYAKREIREGIVIDGKIVVEEQTTPFLDKKGNVIPNQLPKMNPQTKVVITSNGQPVYRRQRFTNNLNEGDIFVPSDRVGVTQGAATAESMLASRILAGA